MEHQSILFEVKGATAQLTLNRPDRLNCLNSEMHREIAQVFRSIEESKTIRSLLITGAGRGFCTGQDAGAAG